MRQMLVHCPAHNRNVAIVVTDEALEHDTQAPVHDPELICLDVDALCAGRTCALCGETGETMDARLVRSGLGKDTHRSVVGECDGCGRVTELLLSMGGYFTCTECGTTSAWRVLGKH